MKHTAQSESADDVFFSEAYFSHFDKSNSKIAFARLSIHVIKSAPFRLHRFPHEVQECR